MSENAAADDSTTQADGLVGSRILIVESDPVLRSEMRSLLVAAGVDAFDVATHDDGIDRLNQGDIDLLVTELPSAGRSGLVDDQTNDLQNAECTADALRWVCRIRKVSPRVPIVLMTQSETEPAACEALMQGAASYVPKRLAANTLVETIRQVFK
ncbi:MAG: hypothetical protein AAF539_16635, partial [Planctomycetota bacterium]